MEPQIQEEKTPPAVAEPAPPLPGGFLKQLVRDSEKETKQKEPEAKEERPVRPWSPGHRVTGSLVAPLISLVDDKFCEPMRREYESAAIHEPCFLTGSYSFRPITSCLLAGRLK